MDLAKALGMMGLGTARVDAHGERDAQEELNAALTRVMEAHEKKKKKALETEKIEERRNHIADKLRDDVRTMHEAYQFLCRKYHLDKERLKEKQQLRGADETVDDMSDFDEEDGTDQVCDLGTALAVKSAINMFKDKPRANNDGEDHTTLIEGSVTAKQ